MNAKEMILTILRRFVESEVGLVKGAKVREIDVRRGFIDVGHPGNRSVISLTLLHRSMETTRTRDLSIISLYLYRIISDVRRTLLRARKIDRFATVPELTRWYCCDTSLHRMNRIIILTCNGDVNVLDKLLEYLDGFPYYWDTIPYVEDVLQEVNEQIKQSSSPAIYELKQLRVA